eukprot:281539-Rhodomonas_salina.1
MQLATPPRIGRPQNMQNARPSWCLRGEQLAVCAERNEWQKLHHRMTEGGVLHHTHCQSLQVPLQRPFFSSRVPILYPTSLTSENGGRYRYPGTRLPDSTTVLAAKAKQRIPI